MKARMSEVPAEMGFATKSIAEQSRNAPVRVNDAMRVREGGRPANNEFSCC